MAYLTDNTGTPFLLFRSTGRMEQEERMEQLIKEV